MMTKHIATALTLTTLAVLASWLAAEWSRLPDAEETRRIARSVHVHVEKRTVREQGAGKPHVEIDLTGNRFDYSIDTSLDNVSTHFRHAVIASEDHHFQVDGVERIAYILAMAAEAAGKCIARRAGFGGAGCRGNSTLSQQLARNLFLGERRSVRRKVVELLWALKMETELDKDEILEFYVNRVYFGNGNYGVEAAARDYFGKSATALTLGEATYLAAAVKSPNWNRRQDHAAALQRGRLILNLMKKHGYAPSDAEINERRLLRSRGIRRPGRPYFGHLWMYVKPEVGKALQGLPDGNYKVWTTVNAEVQIYAERELEREIERWRGREVPVGQGAVVVMRPDGAVLAMVGGAGDDGVSRNINRAKRTKGLLPRPPASTFKPFLYLAALEAGADPDTPIEARPVNISGGRDGRYRPRNHDGRVYKGKVKMKNALVHSINTAAVHLLRHQWVGFGRLFDTVERLGIETSELERDLGLALGHSGVPLVEMAGAYAVFANGGHEAVPHAVIAVVSGSGSVAWQRREPEQRQLFQRSDISALNRMLQEAVRKGTGRSAVKGLSPRTVVAGKTGTGDEFVDAWFIGYTADLVAGVWFGNDRPTRMPGLYGNAGPARTFNGILRQLVRFTDVTAPERPLP